MQTFSSQVLSAVEEIPLPPDFKRENVDLLLVHGSRSAVESPELFNKLRSAYPAAVISGCSTAGEIENGNLYHNSLVFAAIDFESTKVKQVSRKPKTHLVCDTAKEIGIELSAPDLKAVLLYCDGLTLDCDELIKGLSQTLDHSVCIIGGLAADSMDFDRTYVLDGEGAQSGAVVAIGLYGENLKIQSASSQFTPDVDSFTVTQADSNMVFEIENRPAFEAYRDIIGPNADELSEASVHYPFVLKDEKGNPTTCRTAVSTEENGSIIFAGSVPEGEVGIVNLSDPDQLIKDAHHVASQVAYPDAEFAIVINCAGRRMAIGNAMEATEALTIHETIGKEVPKLGFYAYGEFGPCANTAQTEMHNQTVTILSMNEVQT